MSDIHPGYIEVTPGSGYPGEPRPEDLKPFTGPIFFGSESCTGEVMRAHAQMDEAFSHVSGLQQPCHCSEPDCGCEEQFREGWKTVRALARSIVIAMGVEDILKPEPPPEPKNLADLNEQLTVKLQNLDMARQHVTMKAKEILDMLEKASKK